MPGKVALLVVFFAGYMFNDLLELADVSLADAAQAQSESFEETVQGIVEDCEVSVFDVEEGEGWGEIEC